MKPDPAPLPWVLESSYGLQSAEVAPLIRAILATSGLEVLNAQLVARALEHYESRNIDFIDGYIAAVMEKQGIADYVDLASMWQGEASARG